MNIRFIKNKGFAISLVLVFLISVFIFKNTYAQGECGGVFEPVKMQPASCMGTIVVNDAWVSLRPDDSFWYYKLSFRDRVVVDYQENGYYFVKWYFDSSHDPIYGWININKVLLDRDVTP